MSDDAQPAQLTPSSPQHDLGVDAGSDNQANSQSVVRRFLGLLVHEIGQYLSKKSLPSRRAAFELMFLLCRTGHFQQHLGAALQLYVSRGRADDRALVVGCADGIQR